MGITEAGTTIDLDWTLRWDELVEASRRQAIAKAEEEAPNLPPSTVVTIEWIDGAISRRPSEPTTYGLRGGAYEDPVARHALRSTDGEGDDVGDVLRGMPMSAVAVFLARVLAGVGELGRDGAGFDDRHADAGSRRRPSSRGR